MSFGWRVLKLLLNGVLVAASLMLAACVPLHETVDYRYGVLHAGYKPLIVGVQNQPLSLDDPYMVPDPAAVANLADRDLSSDTNQRNEPNKIDMLTSMEIEMLADYTFTIWQSSLPYRTAEQRPADNSGYDADLRLKRHVFAGDKLVTIITPMDSLFWMDIGSFTQLVAIQLNYFCGTDCAPIPYQGDGLLQFDFDANEAHIRAMALRSNLDHQFIGQLDFDLEKMSKNSFSDPNARLVFSIDNTQQRIWNAVVIGTVDTNPALAAIGAFGAADANRDSALTGHFYSK